MLVLMLVYLLMNFVSRKGTSLYEMNTSQYVTNVFNTCGAVVLSLLVLFLPD